jgi:hypothetical protein
MKDMGANFHFQAQLYEAACHGVPGSTDIRFTTLQPKVNAHNEPAWIQAHEFVSAFLSKHGMTLTLSAMAVEFQAMEKPEFQGTFQTTDHGQFIANLVQGMRRPKPFGHRVQGFISKQGWA